MWIGELDQVLLQFGEFHSIGKSILRRPRHSYIPVFARRRRVRRAGPTRLPDSVRFHILWKALHDSHVRRAAGVL